MSARRRLLLSAASTAAIALTVSFASAPPAIAQEEPKFGAATIITMGSSTYGAGQLVGAEAIADRSKNPSDAWTLERAKNAPFDATQEYTVDSADYDPSRITSLAAPDPITPEECRRDFGSRNTFLVKNHYAICGIGTNTTNFWRLENGVKVPIGRTVARITLTGIGGSGLRDGIFNVALDRWASTGETNETATFRMNVTCEIIRRPDGCSATVPNGELNSIAGWKSQAQPQFTQRFITTTPQPEPNDFDAKGYYTFTFGSTDSSGQSSGFPSEPFRCDNATNRSYINFGGCIFTNVKAVITLDASAGSGVTESARFIRDAQNDVTNNTRPGIVGTYVPRTLQRRYSGYDTTNQTDAARRKSTATCRALPPAGYGPTYTTDRTDGLTNDCDEYPLAATYQSSITVPDQNSARSFAVRPVLSSDNQTAGSRISRFTIDDHILDKDPYEVRVIGN